MTELKEPILDTWIDEEQEVEKTVYDFNPETKQLSRKQVKEKIKIPTFYSKGRTYSVSCPDGTHYWEMIDRRKYTIKCKNCPKHRFLNLGFQKLVEGHLIDRDSNTVID